LKYTIGRVAFALGARAAVSINAPASAPKSEHVRNFIMLFPPIIAIRPVLYCRLWPDKTFFYFFYFFCYAFVTPFYVLFGGWFSRAVLSVLFDMARLFLKYFFRAFDPLAPAMARGAQTPHNSGHWHGIFNYETEIVGRFCETPI
jgi:hypothetical protein